MTIVARTPDGKTMDAVLPYGPGAGQVYFHTCAAPAPSYTVVGAGGHLDGLVQAVNNMTGAIPDMAVAMTWISDLGTTFSTTPTAKPCDDAFVYRIKLKKPF